MDERAGSGNLILSSYDQQWGFKARRNFLRVFKRNIEEKVANPQNPRRDIRSTKAERRLFRPGERSR